MGLLQSNHSFFCTKTLLVPFTGDIIMAPHGVHLGLTKGWKESLGSVVLTELAFQGVLAAPNRILLERMGSRLGHGNVRASCFLWGIPRGSPHVENDA